MGVWVTVFLVVLCVIQIFGVRGYGEGEQQPFSGYFSPTG
jgi:amino acid permease